MNPLGMVDALLCAMNHAATLQLQDWKVRHRRTRVRPSACVWVSYVCVNWLLTRNTTTRGTTIPRRRRRRRPSCTSPGCSRRRCTTPSGADAPPHTQTCSHTLLTFCSLR